MTVLDDMLAASDLRCSTQTRNLGERLAGSATAADRFVLVELPLPWPKNIEHHPVLATLPTGESPTGESASHVNTRILAIRRGDDSDSSRHRIISYRSRTTAEGFFGFTGAEVEVGATELGSALAAVLAGDETSLEPIGHITDVLICTHGSRDRCCGSLGSLLVLELEPLVADHVRLWRTSHTGGHRFAPTGMTFPDGLTWGFIDGPTMLGILDRSLDPTTLASHLRGCAGLLERAVQAADAALFERHGWSWLDHPRSHHLVAGPDSPAPAETIRVECESGDTRNQVELQQGEPMPVPICAEPLEAAKKTAAQYAVTVISGD